MASLFNRARVIVNSSWTPTRHVTATCCAVRAFSTGSPSSLAPNKAGQQSTSSNAAALHQLLESVLDVQEDYDLTQSGENQGALLKNLTPNAVISPQQLGPEKLLTPYLPRPNLTQAYPLGPPVTAARTLDPFVRLGLDPLDTSPMNPWLRAEYCTSMGKIKSRGKTGLQRGSQRRMGKAVRRARSMGIVATFGQSIPLERS